MNSVLVFSDSLIGNICIDKLEFPGFTNVNIKYFSPLFAHLTPSETLNYTAQKNLSVGLILLLLILECGLNDCIGFKQMCWIFNASNSNITHKK